MIWLSFSADAVYSSIVFDLNVERHKAGSALLFQNENKINIFNVMLT